MKIKMLFIIPTLFFISYFSLSTEHISINDMSLEQKEKVFHNLNVEDQQHYKNFLIRVAYGEHLDTYSENLFDNISIVQAIEDEKKWMEKNNKTLKEFY